MQINKDQTRKKPSINQFKNTSYFNKLRNLGVQKDSIPKQSEISVSNIRQKTTKLVIEQKIRERSKSQKTLKQPQSSLQKISNYNPNVQLYDVGITIKNFKLNGLIGKGSYASVHEGIHIKSGDFFAVKSYEKYKIKNSQSLRNNITREIKIQRQLNHINIVKLVYAIEDDFQINLVMENPNNTDLLKYLRSQPQRVLPEDEASHIFFQIVEAIHHIHEKDIIHRDIKLENILLDQNFNPKLIDFGFSIPCLDDQRYTVFCGTPTYMSPQIVAKQSYLGRKVDIWALGIVLYNILCGRFPFNGFNDDDLYQNILKGNYQIMDGLSIQAQNLIYLLLQQDEYERPTTAQILEHDWFRMRYQN